MQLKLSSGSHYLFHCTYDQRRWPVNLDQQRTDNTHLYTLPFMQENLQTGCKAIEDRQQKQASRQEHPIGNRIGNWIGNPI